MLTILLPIPASAMSPNARRLWHQKCGPVREARQFARLAAIDAMNRQQIWTPPRWERAETHTRFYFPTNRRRDDDNCMSTLKPVWDGFADAGIVKNDSGFTHHPPTIEVDKIDPRVEVDVCEIDPRVASPPP